MGVEVILRGAFSDMPSLDRSDRVRHAVAAAAAAVDAGLDVYWEPAAERLAEAGFGLDKFPLWNGQVRTTFSPARLNCIVSPKASVHSQSGGICPMFSPIVISWPSPSAVQCQRDWPAAPRHPARSTAARPLHCADGYRVGPMGAESIPATIRISRTITNRSALHPKESPMNSFATNSRYGICLPNSQGQQQHNQKKHDPFHPAHLSVL